MMVMVVVVIVVTMTDSTELCYKTIAIIIIAYAAAQNDVECCRKGPHYLLLEEPEGNPRGYLKESSVSCPITTQSCRAPLSRFPVVTSPWPLSHMVM